MVDMIKDALGPFIGLRNVLLVWIAIWTAVALVLWATPDRVNALFELAGSLFVGLSVVRLMRDKKVRGVSWLTNVFFTSWGIWNVYFYSHLAQWWSLAGGLALALVNVVYLYLMIHYIRKEKRDAQDTLRQG